MKKVYILKGMNIMLMRLVITVPKKRVYSSNSSNKVIVMTVQ